MADEPLIGEGSQVASQQAAGDPAANGQPASGEGEGGEQPAAGAAPNGEPGGGTNGDDDAPEGAPEKYEFTAGEGLSLDETVIGAFSEVAKDLNLTQDAAQKVLDKMAPVIASRQAEQIQAVQSGWREAAMKDTEYGGEKLGENVAIAQKALDQFGSEEFKTLLKESGFGNHPEVIRAFYRVGKATSPDGIVMGKTPNATKNAGDVLYDKS
ncbi:MAG: hypothetical protein PHW66_06415 [Gallionella sp.]|nr:hypothetical protein [Gallionella sp.]